MGTDGEHKTDFRARNVPGTFEKQAPGPKSYRDFRETGPWVFSDITTDQKPFNLEGACTFRRV